MDMKDLALDNCLLACALLALVLDDLALALAIRTDGLEPLDHGAHLAYHSLHTTAVTSWAFFDRTFLTADTVALGADDRLLQSEFRGLALVNVF
jgi:hypothetical protein